jgi:hypothetical protein
LGEVGLTSFPARVTRASGRGAAGGYVIRLLAVQADALPSGGARFVVRLSDPENPRHAFVPTMETQVKRFGVDRCLVVPSALVVGGVLRARHDVLVTLVPSTV